METKDLEKKQIIIEFTDQADLRRQLKAQEKALIGTRTFDVFKPVAIQSEEIIDINQQYFSEEDMMEILQTNYMFKPLRILYPNRNIKAKSGHTLTVVESTLHNNLKNLTLNIFGVTQNQHLRSDQLESAQEFYLAFKILFFEKYQERLSKELRGTKYV